MKEFKLGDLFTRAEIDRAVSLLGAQDFHERVVQEILVPETMARIAALTQQENDRSYLAYMLEYVLRGAYDR
jgi:hypothetical protein